MTARIALPAAGRGRLYRLAALVALLGSMMVQAPDPAPPVVPQAALDAGYLQRALSYDLPLPAATWHGTHNSFNVNNLTGLFFEKPHNQIYGLGAARKCQL